MNTKQLAQQAIDRVKNLDYYTVVIPEPDDWMERLPAPFDINHVPKDNVFSCRVLADSYKSAAQQVKKFYEVER